jgi:hypothetical protein
MYEIQSIYDIEELSYLKLIADQRKISFILFGSTVRRLVLNLMQSEKKSLFELCPFASDIDLLHSGKSEMNSQILADLYNGMPNADCFRWDIRSRFENRIYRQAMYCNALVPVNMMALGTSGLIDNWNGLDDIKSKSYRLIRNGFYKRSKLFKSGKDLEFFAVLIYLRALAEASVKVWQDQPGWKDAIQILREAKSTLSIHYLGENAYLRARLRYLLKGLASSVVNRRELATLADQSELTELLNFIDIAMGQKIPFRKELVFDEQNCIVSSSRVEGDIFRLPHYTDTWASITPGTLLDTFSQELRSKTLTEFFSTSNNLEILTIDRDLNILMASPILQLTPGIPPSSRMEGNSTKVICQEFICFSMPYNKDLPNVEEEDLSAILEIIAGTNYTDKRHIIPLSAICNIVTNENEEKLIHVRMNVGMLLEQAHSLVKRLGHTDEASIRVLIVSLRQLE